MNSCPLGERSRKSDAEDGELVLCTIAKERRHGLKTAQSCRSRRRCRLTRRGQALSHWHAHGIPHRILRQGNEATTDQVRPATSKNREDLRQIPLITIDPEDARDHDDAVWAAMQTMIRTIKAAGSRLSPSPMWPLMSSPGQHAGPRRIQARQLGLFARTGSCPCCRNACPMICVPCVKAKTAPAWPFEMVFDKAGRKRSHRFIRGWMKSAAKLSYTDAQSAIDGNGSGKAETLLDSVLKPLWGAYSGIEDGAGSARTAGDRRA